MKIFVALVVCVAAAQAGFSGGSFGGWEQQVSSGWQQQQAPQQEHKILIIKQQGAHGGSTGGSLTVAGPTHIIKTVHQVRTIDQGGKILSKSSSSSGAPAKVLVVKEVKTAQVHHAPLQQQQSGWAPQQQQGGWARQSSGW